jgi:hypothetical protein
MSRSGFFTGAIDKLNSPLGRRFRGKTSRKSESQGSRSGDTTDSAALDTINMGKSNKFDYTNRPNSGAKLGQIIGAALQKEVEKVKRDAEKNYQKARKQSNDSAGLDDLQASKHILDLKAPGKDLGDEGVVALADGLEIALRSGNSAACLALEDLNLSGNGMTTASFARLAPIIEMSTFDIKTINLANNNISVETNQQAQEWEIFLKSFRGCLKLRRLDLSGNQQLGSRALEIFARIHSTEPPINPIPAGGETSILSLVQEANEDLSASTESMGGFEEDDITRTSKMTGGQFMKKRRSGLRSFPYITFNDVGMDDAGALWLSYIMIDHYYPNQLLDELNATHAESAIKTYQQDANSQGIDWTDGTILGKEGKLLLEKVEVLRRQAMLGDSATIASGILSDDESSSRSLDRRHSKVAAGDRRVSIRSIRTEDGGEHEANEMESLQRKIQRHIIDHDGPHGVELWTASLKVFRASRMILYITSPTRKYYIGSPTFKMPALNIPGAVTVQPPSPNDSPILRSPALLSVDTPRSSKEAAHDRPSYAAKLVGSVAPGSSDVPESPLTEVTNTPVTPMLTQKRTHRHGAFSEGTDLHTVIDKLNVLMVDKNDPKRFILYQQRRIAAAEHRFRDMTAPCHLPFQLLLRIVRLTITGQQMAVLGANQMQIAIERGQNRHSLWAEREWLKRDESAQLWMLLDSMRCLAYGME